MRFEILEDPIIQCLNCGKHMRIPKEDLDYDVFFIGEFGMGPCYEHVFQFEGNCDNCGTQFSFALKGNEYPVGAFDNQYSEVYECKLVFNPPLSVNYIDYDIPASYEKRISEDVRELIDQIKADPSLVYEITSRKFEELVAELFSRKGYDVTLTPAQKDGGKDIIAKRNNDGIPICLYIECKKYDIDNPVGVGIVRSASGVREHDKVNKAIIVTTSRFTRGAFEFAKEEKHMIQLMGLDELLF